MDHNHKSQPQTQSTIKEESTVLIRLGQICAHLPFIPLLLLLNVAQGPLTSLPPQYIYQRLSEDAGLDPNNISFQNNSVCQKDYNKSKDSALDHVQDLSVQYGMYLQLAGYIPTLLFAPFWGALSDKVGRKVPLIYAFLGNLTRSAVLLITIWFHLPLWLLCIAEAINGVFGNVILAAQYIACAFVADNAKSENQNIEIIMVNVWINIGICAGLVIQGFLFQDIGYMYLLGGCSLLELLLLIYAIVFIPKYGAQRQVVESNMAMITKIKDSVTRSLQVMLSPKKYKNLMITLIVLYLIQAPGDVVNLVYLPTIQMGYPLCWRAKMLSLFQGLQSISLCVGGIALLYGWNKTGLREEWLILVAFTSEIVAYIMYGIGWTSWIMFLGAVLNSLGLAMDSTARTAGAKLVEVDQQGALMSGITTVYLVSYVLSSVAFNYIYSATVSVYEGISLFLVAALLLPAYPLVWYLVKSMDVVVEDDRDLLIQQEEEEKED